MEQTDGYPKENSTNVTDDNNDLVDVAAAFLAVGVVFVFFILLVALCCVVRKLRSHERSLTNLGMRKIQANEAPARWEEQVYYSRLSTTSEDGALPDIPLQVIGHMRMSTWKYYTRSRTTLEVTPDSSMQDMSLLYRSREGSEGVTITTMTPRRQWSPKAQLRNARMEIRIDKGSVNVYGNRPPLGQTLRLAQDYYKLETNTEIDIPVESVQVVDKDTNQRRAHSTIFTDDWRDGGVPTSMLFNDTAQNLEDVVPHNEGIFIHQTIGPLGGTMSISGVTLSIPKDALTTPTLVTIGLLWDDQYLPKLTNRQTLLSPIVFCQPSGVKFNAPVTLSFPHAAYNLAQDWDVKIIQREGNLSENAEWSDIGIADCTKRILSQHNVSLDLMHFTLYTCIGGSRSGTVAAKAIQVVAFAGNLSQGDFFKPRIYLLNNYKDEMKTMEHTIDSGSRVRETSVLLVHDNDQDVMVELTDLSAGWKVRGSNIEPVPFEHVWHALHPHCTFVFEQEQQSTEIKCDFIAYQNGRENHSTKLTIAEQIRPEKKLDEANSSNELVNELAILLDPGNLVGSDAGNWRDLAEQMGCGLARIRWLGQHESPTRLLYNEWLNVQQRSLGELEELLRRINRPDAADEVRNRSTLPEQQSTSL